MYRHEIYVVGGSDIDPILTSKLQILSKCSKKKFSPFYNGAGITGKDIYAYKSGILPIGCHHGQRKLTLSEIQFLNTCGKDINLVIYIGSAPCEHLPILRKMYPTIKFLLIDPHFHAFNDDHVYVYQNIHAIDNINHSRFTTIIKNGLQANPREYDNAMRLTNAYFYKSDTHANLLQTLDQSSQDYDTTRDAYDSFTEKNHIDLISDIISGDHMIYIIQDYMTIELSNMLKISFDSAQINNWLLVSDMRTDMIYSGVPSDMDFVWNDAIQMAAIKIMRPKVSMIKFHPPYYADRDIPIVMSLEQYSGDDTKLKIMANDIEYCKKTLNLDMISAYKKRMHMYLTSTDIYIQAWSRPTSAETRLIITRDDIDKPYRNYDHISWDAQFAYLNTIRGYAYFNDFYELVKNHPNNIYCGCFDCMLELLILGDYIAGKIRDNIKIDISRAIMAVKQNTNQLFELVQLFNDVLIYDRDMKCMFHGQLVKVPINLYLYKSVFENRKTILYRYEKNKRKPVLEVSTVYRNNKYEVEYKKLSEIKLAENLKDITCEDTLLALAKSIIRK